jgi:hypothetical protein
MMNAGSPLATAIVRGIYNAFSAAVAAGFAVYVDSNNWHRTAIAAVGAALGALGWRAGAEGLHDQGRAAAGAVRPGDVTAQPH